MTYVAAPNLLVDRPQNCRFIPWKVLPLSPLVRFILQPVPQKQPAAFPFHIYVLKISYQIHEGNSKTSTD